MAGRCRSCVGRLRSFLPKHVDSPSTPSNSRFRIKRGCATLLPAADRPTLLSRPLIGSIARSPDRRWPYQPGPSPQPLPSCAPLQGLDDFLLPFLASSFSTSTTLPLTAGVPPYYPANERTTPSPGAPPPSIVSPASLPSTMAASSSSSAQRSPSPPPPPLASSSQRPHVQSQEGLAREIANDKEVLVIWRRWINPLKTEHGDRWVEAKWVVSTSVSF